ncbi:hypothetical protein [Microbacterium sp.]|uniref:hypothetical protein n=1 Tax=Microbacterium sp. TaxID=51671 RepID=UPI002E35C7ED|nr:hypothetical protein [Microbacterium sp.]HEX5730309.1 hypothetical protein [Microbacterium sp.]
MGDVMARPFTPGRPGGTRSVLDDAARAELDALRIRAYGPSSDISGDDDALARLIELEELALPAPGAEAGPAAVDGPIQPAPPPPRIAPQDAHLVPPSPDEELPPVRRPRWQVGLVAAVAVLALALGVNGSVQALSQASGLASPTPADPETAEAGIAADPDAEIIIRVLIDASSGDYVDLSADGEVPTFPVSGDMTWVQPLGEYYGWALWIGAAPSRRGDEHCLLLADASGTRSRCVAREWRADGELLVSLPYARIAPDERPAGMAADQSVTFLWGPGGFITVLLTPTEGD